MSKPALENTLQEDENQLVLRSLNGDRTAYEKLYRANVGKVYALCLRMCGQKDLAEDLTQEAFIRAWQKLDSFRGDSKFSSWLYRLTSNVVIGHMRSNKKWQFEDYDEGKHEQSLVEISQTTMMAANKKDIEKALNTLSEQARVVLIMHEYLGYKHTEISKITGMAIGTSKTHLHRARAQLKAQAESA